MILPAGAGGARYELFDGRVEIGAGVVLHVKMDDDRSVPR